MWKFLNRSKGSFNFKPTQEMNFFAIPIDFSLILLHIKFLPQTSEVFSANGQEFLFPSGNFCARGHHKRIKKAIFALGFQENDD